MAEVISLEGDPKVNREVIDRILAALPEEERKSVFRAINEIGIALDSVYWIPYLFAHSTLFQLKEKSASVASESASQIVANVKPTLERAIQLNNAINANALEMKKQSDAVKGLVLASKAELTDAARDVLPDIIKELEAAARQYNEESIADVRLATKEEMKTCIAEALKESDVEAQASKAAEAAIQQFVSQIRTRLVWMVAGLALSLIMVFLLGRWSAPTQQVVQSNAPSNRAPAHVNHPKPKHSGA